MIYTSCGSYEGYHDQIKKVCGPIDSFFTDLAYNTVYWQRDGETNGSCTDGKKRGCMPLWMREGKRPAMIKEHQLKEYLKGKLEYTKEEVTDLYRYGYNTTAKNETKKEGA